MKEDNIYKVYIPFKIFCLTNNFNIESANKIFDLRVFTLCAVFSGNKTATWSQACLSRSWTQFCFLYHFRLDTKKKNRLTVVMPEVVTHFSFRLCWIPSFTVTEFDWKPYSIHCRTPLLRSCNFHFPVICNTSFMSFQFP